MVDQLEQLARALHRAGGEDEASRRLLELAAVATMQAAMLEAMLLGPPAQTSRPERVAAGPAAEPLAA